MLAGVITQMVHYTVCKAGNCGNDLDHENWREKTSKERKRLIGSLLSTSEIAAGSGETKGQEM